jgi:hypothetical protein
MISPFEFLDYKMLNVYNWDSNGIGPWKREMRNIDINKKHYSCIIYTWRIIFRNIQFH